jgi:hypothetical protein
MLAIEMSGMAYRVWYCGIGRVVPCPCYEFICHDMSLCHKCSDKVKKKVAALLKGKLVVTIGGESDYRALGIEIGDPEYKLFDLQSHFFVEKKNERDVGIREGHSLRSLAKYYLNKSQQKLHTSLEDAKMTMELFEIYKKVKLTDDGNNLQQKFNRIYPYNFIPVLPNPLKALLKK